MTLTELFYKHLCYLFLLLCLLLLLFRYSDYFIKIWVDELFSKLRVAQPVQQIKTNMQSFCMLIDWQHSFRLQNILYV